MRGPQERRRAVLGSNIDVRTPAQQSSHLLRVLIFRGVDEPKIRVAAAAPTTMSSVIENAQRTPWRLVGLTYESSVSRQERKEGVRPVGLVYRKQACGAGFRKIILNRELLPKAMTGTIYGGRPRWFGPGQFLNRSA